MIDDADFVDSPIKFHGPGPTPKKQEEPLNVIWQRGLFYICDDGNAYIGWFGGHIKVTDQFEALVTTDKELVIIRNGATYRTIEGLWRCGNLSIMLYEDGMLQAALDNRRILLADFD